jgi:NAD(P)-dependent dehydrogenase (short-subunit alcohol dehydrogenase family)
MAIQPAGMAGKTVFVTGATSGIGLETALGLARLGARVIVGARDEARGKAVVEAITGAGGRAEVQLLDMASFASVRRAAEQLLRAYPSLDVLVNNAGTVFKEHQLTADGFERTWQTNFLSHVLLTRLLLPALRRAPKPRVVNVSSIAHTSAKINWENLGYEGEFRGIKAYGQSKLAQILFTGELARREPGISVTALHPGAIATKIWRPAPLFLRAILAVILPSAAKGARPVIRLASAPEVEGVSGKYFDRMQERLPASAGRSVEDAARLWELAERATKFVNPSA